MSDEEKRKRGFAGLSSLASDVDKSVAEETRREVEPEEPAGAQREDNPQSSPRDSEPKSETERPPESEQEVVVSGTSRTPTSGSSRAIWLWGLVGVGLLIWLFNDVQEDSGRTSTIPSNTQASPSGTYSPSPAGLQIHDLEFSKPPVGDSSVLSVAQIRWCLRESIRIEVLRQMLRTNSQVERFNSIVSDYNSRCGSYRYREETLMRAQREVERVRTQIAASVSPPW